jgi:DNA-binding MarR family transcriptional regulator
MTDPYPTPARLALLRNVDAGVVNVAHQEDDTIIDIRDHYRVTARIREMKDAGWVNWNPAEGSTWYTRVRLTDAGRAVLDTHPGGRHA